MDKSSRHGVQSARYYWGVNPFADQAAYVIELTAFCRESLIWESWRKCIKTVSSHYDLAQPGFELTHRGKYTFIITTASMGTLLVAERVFKVFLGVYSATINSMSDLSNTDWVDVLSLTPGFIAKAKLLDDLQNRLHNYQLPYCFDGKKLTAGIGHNATVLFDQSSEHQYLQTAARFEPLLSQMSLSVPVVAVTGTNGKSTSARLMQAIAKNAGHTVGMTSTDGIYIGGEKIQSGDFSGPKGASSVLTHNAIDFACLEVARGGLLRRGLSVSQLDAVLMTNVAPDHLGMGFVENCDDLLEVKGCITKARAPKAPLVLNWHDARLRAFGRTQNNVVWFSDAPSDAVLEDMHLHSQPIAYLKDQMVCWSDGERVEKIIDIRACPITDEGKASYQIKNILGVVALAKSLQFESDLIARTVRSFGLNPLDNPGRLMRGRTTSGANWIIDYAHNAPGVAEMRRYLEQVPANRRFLMVGQVGDRRLQDTKALCEEIVAAKPDLVVIPELERYLRGQDKNRIPHVMRGILIEKGLSPSQILLATDYVAGARQLLAQARSQDLVCVLALYDQDAIEGVLTGERQEEVTHDKNFDYA